MKYLVTKVIESTTSTNKPIYKATLKNEAGEDETINLFDKVGEGQTLEGEIYTNDKNYRNFKSAQKAAGSNYAAAKKEETITKFQDRKTQDIAKAQDRSAWMWAKTNASTLLAAWPSTIKVQNAKEIALGVIELATLIYNGEPTEPFTSYEKSSPTTEYPDGIDMSEIPF